jgi:hypothetical protein
MSAIQLSKRTLSIISNFSHINTGLLLEAHSKSIRVMKETKSVIGVATIEEDLPNNVAIYNVAEFLRCANLYKDPTFDFQAKMVIVSGTGVSSKLKYRYSEPSLITTTPKKTINMPVGVATLDISTDSIDQIMKAANTLGLNDVIMRADGNNIYLEATNLDDSDSNNFKLLLTDSHDGNDFEAHFLITNVNLLKGVYTVTIHPAITQWVSQDSDDVQSLTYYIATEKSSKF